ncbi:MAG: Nicotinate-nucleotide adenylyltransferase [Acidimicrobiaceae bacterium]|nr:MAG: Nicotinate-nucleotide adenylyltransferase [Acidimicrobiaceae bacterium]
MTFVIVAYFSLNNGVYWGIKSNIFYFNSFKTTKFFAKHYYLVVFKEFRRRIGVFGGTFDPPHIGHTSAALAAMSKLELDFVLMMVANDPWQKTDQNESFSEVGNFVTSASHDRYEMLKRALTGKNDLIPDDMEIARGGRTYTVDTVSELIDKFPDSEFFLLIGADVAKDFNSWHEPREICEKVNVVVLTRPGTDLDEINTEWDFPVLDIPSVDVSAKEIRLRVAKGESIEAMVSGPVEEYIFSAGLYRD